MTLKKDDAIKSVMSDFEGYANLVLAQLDLLEEQIGTGQIGVPDKLFDKISENENVLDKLEVKISDKIINTIVLYSPVASDLRKIISCYRIIINLERVGDLVMNIIQYMKEINDQEIYNSISDTISNMLIICSNMVKKALLAFSNNDKELAVWTIKNDSVIDEINSKMVKKAVKKSKISDDNKNLLLNFIHVKEIVTNMERIADHATNIAEAAIYSFEGKDVRHHKLP